MWPRRIGVLATVLVLGPVLSGLLAAAGYCASHGRPKAALALSLAAAAWTFVGPALLGAALAGDAWLVRKFWA